ncbi:hypothetical protein DY000_02020496 [Brassica cretica]|uniref:Uncharacterized protein n=1 Tax=Brassica cretica TaxID=69181 RepID=A0ABQ7EH90_BRACR|nr:hypothetical protein DY000_02020496 [Brassica cretica]
MHGFVSYRRFGRGRSLRSDQAGRTLGRYRPSFGSSSVATYRPSETDARSLRSDRAWLSNGRRECMDPCRIDDSEERPSGTDAQSLHSDRAGWTLGLYVATERDVCSVATWRPSLARARSLRSDRATFFGLFSDVSCFFRRALPPNRLQRTVSSAALPTGWVVVVVAAAVDDVIVPAVITPVASVVATLSGV